MVLRPERYARQSRNGSHFCQQKPDDGDVDLGCGYQCTRVHCATGKVVCERSCHVTSQATTELERDLRFSSVTDLVATLNVPVPSYFSARFLGQLFEEHENRHVASISVTYVHTVHVPHVHAYIYIQYMYITCFKNAYIYSTCTSHVSNLFSS